MSLKSNTQKLLTFLYSPDQPFFGSYQHLSYLLPTLSAAGCRSLVSHLVSQGLVTTERRHRQSLIRLTQPGQRRLEQLFPAFSSLNGEQQLVLFLKPPQTDPQFRYLRQLLLKMSALPLSRGAYLVMTGAQSSTSSAWFHLMHEVETSYSQAVVILAINRWHWGDQRQLASAFFGVNELIESYSGISNELKELLKDRLDWMSLSHPQKQQLFLVFNRLYSLIQKDSGWLTRYSPQVDNASRLLQQWQSLVNNHSLG